jgi:hypothetical protein
VKPSTWFVVGVIAAAELTGNGRKKSTENESEDGEHVAGTNKGRSSIGT